MMSQIPAEYGNTESQESWDSKLSHIFGCKFPNVLCRVLSTNFKFQPLVTTWLYSSHHANYYSHNKYKNLHLNNRLQLNLD